MTTAKPTPSANHKAGSENEIIESISARACMTEPIPSIGLSRIIVMDLSNCGTQIPQKQMFGEGILTQAENSARQLNSKRPRHPKCRLLKHRDLLNACRAE